MTPRGRRPGDEDTRERILDSARRLFAQRGFERASMRVIARDAEVDPALIVHYFGSKQALLEECLQLPLDPRVVLSAAAQAPPDQRGELLVRALVAAGTRPAATAAAEPPELPPGMALTSHGFFTAPKAEFSLDEPMANSSILVLPSITRPAWRHWLTT